LGEGGSQKIWRLLRLENWLASGLEFTLGPEEAKFGPLNGYSNFGLANKVAQPGKVVKGNEEFSFGRWRLGGTF